MYTCVQVQVAALQQHIDCTGTFAVEPIQLLHQNCMLVTVASFQSEATKEVSWFCVASPIS